MVFGISSRVLTLVGTLILTRFIAPDAYGAVLAASISVQSAAVLTSFAFGQYLIARKASPAVAFQAAELHVGLGVVAMAALIAFREPIGDLLDTPDMGPYVAWYALAHLIDRARAGAGAGARAVRDHRRRARQGGGDRGDVLRRDAAPRLAGAGAARPRDGQGAVRLRPADHDQRGRGSRGDAVGQPGHLAAVR